MTLRILFSSWHFYPDPSNGASISDCVVVFYSGEYVNRKFVTISDAHAGDNYIVASNPNAGPLGRLEFKEDGKTLDFLVADQSATVPQKIRQNVPDTVRTPKLTVWRTLWAERDFIKLQPLNILSAATPLISGIVESELKRACIQIIAFAPNPRPFILGPEFVPDKWASGANTIASNCRDIPQPSETFWTIHLIGAFRSLNDPFLGCYFSGFNTVFVFNWTIQNMINDWNAKNPGYFIPLDKLLERVSLHEIGHAFTLPDRIEPKKGVMVTGLLDAYCFTKQEFSEFSPEDIKIIQMQSVVQ